jgi:catalase
MPLPSDEKIVALGNDLIKIFDTLFGLHPGFRPAHAKGILLTGTFTPSPGAASLTRAPHVTRESTPVIARFSNSTGVPVIPDNDPNASPRGLALRFVLGEHIHTDIVAHSTDGFPTHTGEEFLEFLRAVVAGDPSGFLATHPATLAFVQTPKPTPASFAKEAYFGITAFKFTNSDGVAVYGRYRIKPEAGVEHLDDAVAAGRDANFLFEELAARIAKEPVGFRIEVQVANPGDVTDDATIHWPEDRPRIELGRVLLTALLPDSGHEQKKIIFDPIPRVDGIEPSDDPLLELRAAVYLLSGRRRRQAPE